jgi:dipeptidyl aminopeptidase/acylaminoacyl peptidase
MKNLIRFSALLFLFACSQTEQKSPDQYSIEQFYKNTRFDGGSFSDDETRLLVSSDESGIFNVYEITIKNDSRQQITFSDTESYYAVDYVPGSDQILYTADKGGNEINHIYLLQNESLSTDLTPAENENAIFGMWSEDKKSMFYLSNKRDERFFDMYKMGNADWKAEMIYRNDEGLDINDISHNENIFILTKYITTTENKMFLFDNNQKKMTEISQEPGNYSSSGFSKDDRYLYYITNTGKEFAYLVQYEIATGKRDVLYETNWDVMYSYLSENDRYRVIAINEDGKNNLILLDNKTQNAVNFPEIPDGDIKDVNISESEKLLRLTVGTSKAPNNIYVYNLEDKSLKKLTESLNPEINPDNLVSAEVVRFKSFDDLEIPAIFYKPIVASKKNKVPALIWVHGGPGGQSRVGYFALIQYLVNHGYAILAVNNRGSSGYGKTFFKMDDLNHGDKDLKDCIWGKKWLQSQDYIDKEKIGILGGSYGGFMTMAAMTFTPDEFKVGVNLFGVTNWLRTLRSIPPYWESQRAALFAEMGDPTTADSIHLYDISPLFHAENIKNPIMVLQGANDPRVLQVESDEIVAAVKNNNVPVEYVIFPDEGHGFVKKENEINGYGKILEFLDRYLKEEEVN